LQANREAKQTEAVYYSQWLPSRLAAKELCLCFLGVAYGEQGISRDMRAEWG